jgi:hypothetical protein
MPYWDVVTRSFGIAWRHKYLWLLALFSGEAGGGLSFNSSFSQPSNQRPDIGAMQSSITTWLSDHIALVVALGVLWLVLVVAFFILGAVCEGAVVRGAAEHDAERPFSLRQAWTVGVRLMWVIVRFRLLLFLFYLPLIVLIVAWAIGLLVSAAHENGGSVAALVLVGVPLVLVWIAVAIYLFYLDRFGSRAIVLEERMAVPAIARAHRLLFKRFGRSLLVGLLAVGVGIVVGVVLLCFSVIVALPFGVGLFAAYSSGSAAFWPVLVLAVLILLPIYLLVAGFLGAQSVSYWTLAFRRLDVDYPPVPATYAPSPQTPPAPPAIQP